MRPGVARSSSERSSATSARMRWLSAWMTTICSRSRASAASRRCFSNSVRGELLADLLAQHDDLLRLGEQWLLELVEFDLDGLAALRRQRRDDPLQATAHVVGTSGRDDRVRSARLRSSATMSGGGTTGTDTRSPSGPVKLKVPSSSTRNWARCAAQCARRLVAGPPATASDQPMPTRFSVTETPSTISSQRGVPFTARVRLGFRSRARAGVGGGGGELRAAVGRLRVAGRGRRRRLRPTPAAAGPGRARSARRAAPGSSRAVRPATHAGPEGASTSPRPPRGGAAAAMRAARSADGASTVHSSSVASRSRA